MEQIDGMEFGKGTWLIRLLDIGKNLSVRGKHTPGLEHGSGCSTSTPPACKPPTRGSIAQRSRPRLGDEECALLGDRTPPTGALPL